ncbi:hypothetical protein [Nonomuraea sp. NPDC050783]|uniref:hypothetical protein n=1 Tax=Nonomuraea sp. NPDC050783 TaxID=3154634 RepID=UPI0034671C5A
MRRHRFGRIAALIALSHLALVVVLGVLVPVTGRGEPLWTVVTRDSGLGWFFDETFVVPPWLAFVLVPIGAVQAWALWQVLRGRVRGEPAHRGRAVALLRLALYAGVAQSVVMMAVAPLAVAWEAHWVWTVAGIFSGVVQPAVVWLFFVVLRGGVSRGLRVFSLVVGIVASVGGLGQEITAALGLDAAGRVLALGGFGDDGWLVWGVSILVAQARDPRWSAATVRIGVVSQVMAVLQPGGGFSFGGGGGFPVVLVVHALLGAVSVFGLVWQARTAHELAEPLRGPVPRRVPERAPARWWPLAVLAVVLPLVPAAVNLARGRYHWIGPRGVIERFVRVDAGGDQALLWLALDVLVGVGVPALLVLAAVVRRTRPVVRSVVLVLAAAAAVGFVSALTVDPELEESGAFFYEGVQIYPEGLFAPGPDGEVFFGLSPAWYSAALLASALLLMVLYPAAPARRVRHHVLPAVAGVLAVLVFVPVGDQEPGPATAAGECAPRDGRRGEPEPPEPTREAARLRAVERLAREALTQPLAQICPSAGAVIRAMTAERDRESEEWAADARRACDTAPRHRPLVRPVAVTRVKWSSSTPAFPCA